QEIYGAFERRGLWGAGEGEGWADGIAESVFVRNGSGISGDYGSDAERDFDGEFARTGAIGFRAQGPGNLAEGRERTVESVGDGAEEFRFGGRDLAIVNHHGGGGGEEEFFHRERGGF